MKFQFNDGGRSTAGFKGDARDCVCRAIAIAGGMKYADVYKALADGAGSERKSRGKSARNGIFTGRKWFNDLMAKWGFVWTPTMQIGQGCKVHLRESELPKGSLVVSVTRHLVAVVDGVIHDTSDCSRDGQRCVYGYWRHDVAEGKQ